MRTHGVCAEGSANVPSASMIGSYRGQDVVMCNPPHDVIEMILSQR